MTTIATWNCNMAFREKNELLLRYDPDVVVIQACENPREEGQWDEFTDWRWIGDNKNKGLGIFSRSGIEINSVISENSDARYALPVRLDNGLDILGIWAMNDDKQPQQRYIGQVYTALQHYRDHLSPDTVVAGDFNWNVIWDDSPRCPLYGDFTETVEELHQIGLKSSYHYLTDTSYGEEETPTFYMHKKKDRSYHTDYLFIPESMIDDVSEFEVGSFEEWIDMSDHMPLVIEIDH